MTTTRFLDTRLPPELEERVARELEPGEQVLWVGQPDPWKTSRISWVLVIFGLMGLGFGVNWIYSTLGGFGDAPGPGRIVGWIFSLFGLMPLLGGLGMMSAPYWFHRKAKRTGYALTNRRAILFEAGYRGSTMTTASFGPDKLAAAQRREHPDGSGDLIFEVVHRRDSDGDRRQEERGFMAIKEIRAVETLVRQSRSP